MKKDIFLKGWFALLLSVALCFSACSLFGGDDDDDDGTTEQATQTNTATNTSSDTATSTNNSKIAAEDVEGVDGEYTIAGTTYSVSGSSVTTTGGSYGGQSATVSATNENTISFTITNNGVSVTITIGNDGSILSITYALSTGQTYTGTTADTSSAEITLTNTACRCLCLRLATARPGLVLSCPKPKTPERTSLLTALRTS